MSTYRIPCQEGRFADRGLHGCRATEQAGLDGLEDGVCADRAEEHLSISGRDVEATVDSITYAVGAILMSASTIVVAFNAQLLRRVDLRPS